MTERNTGFDDDAFEILLEYEDWHWWFQNRNRLIIRLMKRFGTSHGRILEIGCGNGLVTEAISREFPKSEIVATEFLAAGLVGARKRLPQVRFEQLDARDLNGSETYDIICAFDVLEHIDADVEVMKRVRNALRDERSRFFITVPQHMTLWSEADVFAHHERRYTFREMRDKLRESGFELEYRTSYVFLLSPLMLLSRLRKQKHYDPQDEFRIGKPLNAALSGMMRIESLLRRFGLPMPFGGSLVVVARPVQPTKS